MSPSTLTGYLDGAMRFFVDKCVDIDVRRHPVLMNKIDGYMNAVDNIVKER